MQKREVRKKAEVRGPKETAAPATGADSPRRPWSCRLKAHKRTVPEFECGLSDFGLRPSFDPRPSGFGFPPHPTSVSSHPARYSRPRHLLASATLVTLPAAASKSSRLPPNRNETAPRLKASDIGPAWRKSP